ncbi:MAG: ribonuclease P protein component [Pseudomonadales bacterium]
MADFDFSRDRRLLTAKDYQFVFSSAELKAAHPQLLMLARPNSGCHARVGLVISKKHVKLATARNRIKRLLRESFRQRANQLPALDIIVLSRPGIAKLDNHTLTALIEKQWNKLAQRAASNTPQ